MQTSHITGYIHINLSVFVLSPFVDAENEMINKMRRLFDPKRLISNSKKKKTLLDWWF